jgi:hypothetical protein
MLACLHAAKHAVLSTALISQAVLLQPSSAIQYNLCSPWINAWPCEWCLCNCFGWARPKEYVERLRTHAA